MDTKTRKTAHTQEPWYTETVYMADNTPYEAIRANVNGAPYTIAVLDCFDGAAPEEEVLANRDLIVAAPALVAALEVIQREMNALRNVAGEASDANMRKLGLSFDWRIVDRALAATKEE